MGRAVRPRDVAQVDGGEIHAVRGALQPADGPVHAVAGGVVPSGGRERAGDQPVAFAGLNVDEPRAVEILWAAGFGIQARRDAQAAADGDERDAAVRAVAVSAGQQRRRAGVGLVVLGVAHAAQHLLPQCPRIGTEQRDAVGAEPLLQRAVVAGELLAVHARIEHGVTPQIRAGAFVEIGQHPHRMVPDRRGRGQRVVERLGVDVGQILVGERLQQQHPVGFGPRLQETGDNRPIAAGQTEDFIGVGVAGGRLPGESLKAFDAHGFRAPRPVRAHGLLLRRQRRGAGTAGGGRGHRQRRPCVVVSAFGIQRHGHRGGGCGVNQRLAEPIRRRGVHQHGAEPELDGGTAVLVGGQLGDRREFGHIEQFKAHVGTGHGGAVGIGHRDGQSGGRRVGGREVLQYRGPLPAGRRRNIDRSGRVIAEHAGVNQHRAGRRTVEPSAVQPLLGLAGPHETPDAVDHRLNPGMVVVAMRPTRGVHLTRGDADGAQGAHQQRGFFPAAARAAVQRADRTDRADVGGGVGHMFGAPVIGLDRGAFHAKRRNPCVQLACDAAAAWFEALVVDPRPEHVVDEDVLRQLRGPCAAPAQLQGVVHVVQQRRRLAFEDIGGRQGADEQMHQGAAVAVEPADERVGGDRQAAQRRLAVAIPVAGVVVQCGGQEVLAHGCVLVTAGWIRQYCTTPLVP